MDAQLPSFHVLQVIKEAQQQHGLRHGDYQRYRQFCSRKLRRVRRSLKLQFIHDSRQCRKQYLDPEKVEDHRYLTLLVFEADRNWAFAMQLKQEANPDNRKRFHLMRKLRAAVKNCQQIEKLCRQVSKFDAATKLEVQAYCCWMRGCLSFEARAWTQAAESFTAAKTIYRELSSVTDMPNLVEIYKQRCREIQPHLRFCQFNMGGDSSALDDLVQMRLKISDQPENTMLPELNKLLAECRQKQSNMSEMEVMWCGRRINFSKSSRTASFYNSLMEFDRQLKEVGSVEAELTLYEQLLSDCRDVMQSIREEAKNETFKVKAVEGESYEKLSNANVMFLYVSQLRLTKSIERYSVMIRELGRRVQKPNEAIRLYDSVLQNFHELQSLALVQLSPALTRELQFFKALRCCSMADVFMNQNKWPEALALFDRAVQYVDMIRGEFGGGAVQPCGYLTEDRLYELQTQACRGLYAAHANCALSHVKKPVELVEEFEEPIFETLDTRRKLTYTDLKEKVKLVRIPPNLQPVGCKPLFFDLALNYVRFPPELDKAIARMDPNQEAPKTGGIGNLVKGWLWGSKK